MQDRKFTFKNRPSGYFGSVLIGLAFAGGGRHVPDQF